MANVCATLADHQPSSTWRPLSDAAVWPSWTPQPQNALHTVESFVGYTTIWTVDGLTRRAASTPTRPTAVALANFAPCSPSEFSFLDTRDVSSTVSWKSHYPACLCVAADLSIVFSTRSAPFSKCSLRDARVTSETITGLFNPPTGLIIEISPSTVQSPETPSYYYLPHPLLSFTLIPVPTQHRIIFVSSDINVLVTRQDENLHVWSFSESMEAASNAVDASTADPISELLTSVTEPDSNPLGSVMPRGRVLSLVPLFVTACDPGVPVSVFLAHDLQGLLVLCLCASRNLTGLSLSFKDLEVTSSSPAFRIRDVSSAVPILAVRRPHACLDTLVRHHNGKMSLFMGRNRLCSVDLDPIETKDAYIAHAVAHQFSLISQGEARRFTLRTACFESPLVNAALASISYTFVAHDNIRRITALYHDVLAAKSVSCRDHTLLRNTEWHIFEHVLLQMAGIDISLAPSALEYLSETRATVQSDGPSDDDWLLLLKSSSHLNLPINDHKKLYSSPIGRRRTQRPNSLPAKPAEADILRLVLRALHLLYEDLKLDSVSNEDQIRLLKLNVLIARSVGAISFVDHYRRDFPTLELFDQSRDLGTHLDDLRVPSIFDYLTDRIREEGNSINTYPCFPEQKVLRTSQTPFLTASWRSKSPYDLSRRIVKYFECLSGSEQRLKTPAERAEQLLLAMVSDNFSRSELDTLPFGVALPLRDALWLCRRNPNTSWPYSAFALIGREDLFNYADLKMATTSTPDPEQQALIQASRALLRINADVAAESYTQESLRYGGYEEPVLPNSEVVETIDCPGDGGDGCEIAGEVFKLRFSDDRRVEEVKRLLRSTDLIVLTPVDETEHDNTVEFDLVTEQKRKLEILLRKRFAAPVGRGAFTLRTFRPSDPTKSLPVPKIRTSGKLYSQKGVKVTVTPVESQFEWGEFHNGVAAGLRLVTADTERESDAGHLMCRSWIVKHRPSSDDASGNATHAGMLFALGLGGYLPALRRTDYYQYLLPRHDLTSIGLMLGLAAGNVGSMPAKITKMMCLHIKHFNGPGFAVPDFNVSVNVQTAAILSLGLLHMGSCEHLLVEGLFEELGYRPKPGDPVEDREGFAVAAGLSIGLICLGKGSSAFDAADSRFVERLMLYANGGSAQQLESIKVRKEVSAGKSDAGVDRPNSATTADSETSRVKEQSFVNTEIVSPGALLALALIFLKQNDRRLAERIIVPDTMYSLDRTRPSNVFLSVMARSLILWDSIDATKEWILESLPQILRARSKSGQYDVFNLLGESSLPRQYKTSEYDTSSILHARAFAVAGACTAMALKYAGTSNPEAISILMEGCEAYEGALMNEDKDNEGMDWLYTTGLCSLSLSLSVIAAGSGNLGILKLLRRQRKRRAAFVPSGRYGPHLAIHMAIGFLFLGGGCQTFGTSDIAIASLLCAIYPQFPRDVNDNRHHLQALRHLYVLAAEPRCIETRDVDTGRPCRVEVEVRLKAGGVLRLHAPSVLPEARDISEVAVVCERYLHTTVGINPPVDGRGWYSASMSQVIFVKRRDGHLPFSADPKGSKGILARTVGRLLPSSEDVTSNAAEVEHLVKVFNADPGVLAFVKFFCSLKAGSLTSEKNSMCHEDVRRYVHILYECLSADKADALKVYFDAERVCREVMEGSATPSSIGSLLIIDAYIHTSNDSMSSLVRPEFLSRIIQICKDHVENDTALLQLYKYISTGGRDWPGPSTSPETRKSLVDLSIALRLNRIPKFVELANLSTCLKAFGSTESSSNEIWLGSVGLLSDNCFEVLMKAIEVV